MTDPSKARKFLQHIQDSMLETDMSEPFEEIGSAIGRLVQVKNDAYGDSFGKSEEVLKILYPYGVGVEQFRDFLTVVRVLDKLFRIATDRDALGEDPWKDICGYAILAIRNNDTKK